MESGLKNSFILPLWDFSFMGISKRAVQQRHQLVLLILCDPVLDLIRAAVHPMGRYVQLFGQVQLPQAVPAKKRLGGFDRVSDTRPWRFSERNTVRAPTEVRLR